MLNRERLPHTRQASCGLSLTTSHSAHKTAFCSGTAFRTRARPRESTTPETFITEPRPTLTTILPVSELSFSLMHQRCQGQQNARRLIRCGWRNLALLFFTMLRLSRGAYRTLPSSRVQVPREAMVVPLVRTNWSVVCCS